MIIKHGRMIDPGSGFDGIADIVIKDGKIEKIYRDGESCPEPEEGEEIVDASGLVWLRDLWTCMCISETRDSPIRRTLRRELQAPRQGASQPSS